ncbi:MAG: efflux RND transporter periplasmic adaptor subunit [Bacteroidota bacterium]
MKVKHIVYIILIIGLGTLVGYRILTNKSKADSAGKNGSGKETAGKGGSSSPLRVNGVVLKPQRFANSIAVSGSIEANEQVMIRSQVAGLVRGIYFQEGSKVSKGKVLLQIDNAELEAQLAQALTRQKLAAENTKRAELLVKKGGISQQEYDIVRADLETLQAQTQLIRAQLDKTTIRAPFDGTIGLRTISDGEYLSPTTVVAKLVNTNPVKLTFSIPEKYANLVKNNTTLSFTLSESEKKYTAVVYAMEPSIEATTRTLQLRARADNPNGELIPGAFATVELPLTVIEDALLVPTEAIVPIQNGKKVFVVENGQAKEVKVETSTRRDKDILVTTGLQAGDTVLTTGVMALKPQTPVKVTISKTQ